MITRNVIVLCYVQFPQTVNFFDPPWTIKGKPYKVFQYEEILKEQMLITTLSQGGISIEDTNNLPISDRVLLLHTLIDMEQQKRDAINNAAPVMRGKH